jgi:ribonuclease Z
LVDLKLVFLGTSSAVPTAERGLSSVAMIRDGEVILVDAGEGVQRSFAQAGIGFNRNMKVLITHLHGDHCVGLLGLLQTMAMLNRDKPLSVYGPRGLLGFVKNNIKSLKFGLSFPLSISTVREGLVVDEKEYRIRACRGEHNITNYAFLLEEKERPGVFHPEAARRLGVPEGELWSKLQDGEAVKIGERTIGPLQVMGPKRPGRKVVVTGDTRPTLRLRRFIAGADTAVLDSTYFDDHADKAKENRHMTAREAAEMASRAGVRRLVLTHFSSRYEDLEPYLQQASEIHPNLVAAADQMVLDVPYPDET